MCHRTLQEPVKWLIVRDTDQCGPVHRLPRDKDNAEMPAGVVTESGGAEEKERGDDVKREEWQDGAVDESKGERGELLLAPSSASLRNAETTALPYLTQPDCQSLNTTHRESKGPEVLPRDI